MGQNDYQARKGAKKARKRAARESSGRLGFGDGGGRSDKGGGDKGVKRVRAKKNPVRSLCRGLCYKDPVLTAEDRDWPEANGGDGHGGGGETYSSDVATTDGEDDGVAELAERQRSHHAASSSSADADGKAFKRQRLGAVGSHAADPLRRQRDALKLSTAVHLLDPSQAAEQASQSAAARRANKQHAAAAAAGRSTQPGIAAAELRTMQALFNVPEVLHSWPPVVQQFMAEQGFSEPTPIQERCWPLAAAGQDVQGVAEPGSGKTLAYLLPGVLKLLALGHSGSTQPEGPLLVVLLPTRELAAQVAVQMRLLRKLTGLRSACVFGGVPREKQEELLRSKLPHMLAATPGRLLDLIDAGCLKLTHGDGLSSGVQYVVLDEADKMLNLGWAPQLDRLRTLLLGSAPPVACLAVDTHHSKPNGKGAKARKAAAEAAATATTPAARPQVLLFTATMPQGVAEAASTWLAPSAARVEVRTTADTISRTITQVVQVCAEHKKQAKLLKHLLSVRAASAGLRQPPKVLIFANKIEHVRSIVEGLTGEGFRVAMLHGKRSQPERDAAMRDFKSGKTPVLVATDVAARGLDVRALPYVINYDFPSSLDTYIHRVGRTGRLAANGHAYSFFTRNLARLAEPLVKLLQHHGQAVDPNLVALAEAWSVAAAKLGADAERVAAALAADAKDAEEEPEVEATQAATGPAAGDLLEGLNVDAVPTKPAAKLSHKGIWGVAAKAATDNDEGQGGEDAREALIKRRRHAADAAAAAAATAAIAAAGPGTKRKKREETVATPVAAAVAPAQQSPPAFSACSKFVGARPGYVFKLGPQGLGYYLDRAPAVSAKVLAVKKARGQPIVPARPSAGDVYDSDSDIGALAGGGDGSDGHDSGSGDEDSDREGSGKPGRSGGKRPGAAGRGKGGRGGPGLTARGVRGTAVAKRKAVPGRMRKKLQAAAKAK